MSTADSAASLATNAPAQVPLGPRPEPPILSDSARLESLVRQHHGLVWRTVRRLGVSLDDAEDATQRVFMVVARRLGSILPGEEQSFLVGVALRVASEVRRSHRRRREDLILDRCQAPDPHPLPDETLCRDELLTTLGDLLSRMPSDQQAVFVLHELEGMTMAEIARVLGLPSGTVASRLRQARIRFKQLVAKWVEGETRGDHD